jgi:TetR/AcrR family transcriptional regulator
MGEQERKRTQRARLIAGMVAVANRHGYANATVSAVIAEAGVSRPTFYDYFDDRDHCFRATIEEAQEQLSTLVRKALTGVPAERSWETGVRALVDYADAERARALFLMGEALAGGPGALDTRDRGIAGMAASIEDALKRTPASVTVPDLEPRVAIGSAYRLIAARLRRGEVSIAPLAEGLRGWIAAFARPAGERRWVTLRPASVSGRSREAPLAPVSHIPSVLPAGRPKLSSREIAENHRLRILYGAAKMAELKGYTATTVTDITKLARVDGRVFYRLFADKQQAFGVVHELGFQQMMGAIAKGFFSTKEWPKRSWEGARALTQLLQANPLMTHVGFVEAYAMGPSAVQRVEDAHAAFLFLLEEGLMESKTPPSRAAMEAIMASAFEVIYLQARRGKDLQVAGMLPHIAHLWLTPFLGPRKTDAFIDRQMRSSRAAGRRQAQARPRAGSAR